jgi:hypothetical protein
MPCLSSIRVYLSAVQQEETIRESKRTVRQEQATLEVYSVFLSSSSKSKTIDAVNLSYHDSRTDHSRVARITLPHKARSPTAQARREDLHGEHQYHDDAT